MGQDEPSWPRQAALQVKDASPEIVAPVSLCTHSWQIKGNWGGCLIYFAAMLCLHVITNPYSVLLTVNVYPIMKRFYPDERRCIPTWLRTHPWGWLDGVTNTRNDINHTLWPSSPHSSALNPADQLWEILEPCVRQRCPSSDWKPLGRRVSIVPGQFHRLDESMLRHGEAGLVDCATPIP